MQSRAGLLEVKTHMLDEIFQVSREKLNRGMKFFILEVAAEEVKVHTAFFPASDLGIKRQSHPRTSACLGTCS